MYLISQEYIFTEGVRPYICVQ